MKITVLGAGGGEVTGSCYLVETSQARVLVDCGLFQGTEGAGGLNRPPLGASSARLNAVVLTHAHLDHVGRLPMLDQTGFAGPIHATPATIEMTGLILRDAAKIQQQDADRHNRNHGDEAPQHPLYTMEEVEAVLRLLKPVPYDEPVPVAPGIRACYAEAGHMLGSTSIKLFVEDGGVKHTIVFSGDLGPKGAPILRDFETFSQADMVFLESTYGDRDHQPFADTVRQFIEIVKRATEQKGKILVPTFAVGRAQLLTLLLASIFRQKIIAPFPVFLDSPMAIEASRIYARHSELFDEDMVAYLKAGPIAPDLATLKMSSTADDSKAINNCPGPCLIMAGAGMCTAGRILHHLRHNLGNPQAHVIIVGFQARGSLGRMLVDGARKVTIFGEPISVHAQVHTLGGFSAHAGQTDLLKWFEYLAPVKPRVMLTHGENGPRRALAQKITERFGLTPSLPALNEVIEF
ncbi:MAG: MBL fold metallo-hydrolase [Methylacidiphilales bacterium]|nr:MBL fold metallo-hydrolase [Candidatus Methylacidiphilales bacterium]